MKLDLRFNAAMHPQIIPLFDDIAYSNRNSFNCFIDVISRPLIKNIDWWAENPASRNTYVSPLFHYFCCINLLLSIFKENNFEIEEIYVDSRELLNVLNNILQKYNSKKTKIIFKPGLTLSFKRFLKRHLYYEWYFLKRFLQIIIARLSKSPSESNLPDQPITLIDTFLTKDYLTNDRWYGSFWDHLDDTLKAETFFVPSIINTSLQDMRYVFTALKNSSRNTIIKDDFLSMSDILYAYQHKKRVKNISVEPYFHSDINLSGLVKEDIINNRDVAALMESLLTYRFLYQISKINIKVRLSIDWFEGHSLDKLWNLGMKQFFPNIKRIGYQTFRSFPYYLSTYPIAIERDAHTIPDIFAVQGKSCVACIKEFLPDQDVMVIPAFRYEHVWQWKYDQLPSDKHQILVALPISLDASIRILEILIDAHNNDPEIRAVSANYIVKPHPTHTIKEIKDKLRKDLPPSFQFSTEQSFPKLLEHSTILITEASSTCLEAFAYGKSVIIIENPTGLTYNPVPENIPQDLFIKCRSPEKLDAAIQHFLSYKPYQLKKNQKIGMEIRNDYFEQITKKGIYRFLDINFDKE